MAKYTIVGSKTVNELDELSGVKINSNSKFIASDGESAILKRISYGGLSSQLYNDVSTSISTDMLNNNFYTRSEIYNKSEINSISSQLSTGLNLNAATNDKLGGIKLFDPSQLTSYANYAVQLDDNSKAYVQLDDKKLSALLEQNKTIRNLNDEDQDLQTQINNIAQDISQLQSKISTLDPDAVAQFEVKVSELVESCTRLNGTSMRNTYLTLGDIDVENLVTWLSSNNLLSILLDDNQNIVQSRVNSLAVTFDFEQEEDENDNTIVRNVLNIHARCDNEEVEAEQLSADITINIEDDPYSTQISSLPIGAQEDDKAILLSSIVDESVLSDNIAGGLSNAIRFLVDDTFQIAFIYNNEMSATTSGIDVKSFLFESFNEGKIDGQISSYVLTALNNFNTAIVQPIVLSVDGISTVVSSISTDVSNLSTNLETISANTDSISGTVATLSNELSAGSGDYYASLSAHLSADIYNVFKNIFQPKTT